MNYFTEESVRRLEAVKRQTPKSIHPFGRSAHNMSKSKSPSVVARVRAGLERHLAEHPRDGASASHLAKVA